MANLTRHSNYKMGGRNGYGSRILNAFESQRLLPAFLELWTQEVPYTDVQTASLNNKLDLNATYTSNPFPENCIPVFCWVEEITAYAGTDITDVKVEVGDAGTADELLTSTDVDTGTAGIKAGQIGTNVAFESAYVPLFEFTATTRGATDLSDLTAGLVRLNIVFLPVNATGDV